MFSFSWQEIILGLTLQAGQDRDRFIDSSLTNFLFENIEGEGTDLMARNIQRGRDHGLPSYNEFREFCGMERVCEWSDVPDEIDIKVNANYTSIYIYFPKASFP